MGSMSPYIAAPWILWDKTSIQCGCSWLTRMLCFQPLTSIVRNVIENMNWICPPRKTLKSIFSQEIATRSRTSCPEVSPFPLPRPSRGVAAAFGTREKLSVCTVDTADDTVWWLNAYQSIIYKSYAYIHIHIHYTYTYTYTLYIIHYTYTLYIIHYTYTLYIIHYTLYIIHFTLYIIHYTLYIIHIYIYIYIHIYIYIIHRLQQNNNSFSWFP